MVKHRLNEVVKHSAADSGCRAPSKGNITITCVISLDARGISAPGWPVQDFLPCSGAAIPACRELYDLGRAFGFPGKGSGLSRIVLKAFFPGV